MPSGSISLANAVPAPPGVFATSMPPDLSSEDRDSSSDSNNLRVNTNNNSHSTSMVNGGGSLLTQSLSTSNCAYASMPPNSTANSHQSSSSKSPHFVMVRGEGVACIGGEDDPYKNSNKVRKRNKSGRRLKEVGNRPNGTPNDYGSSSVNKPLKVTIRRTAHSHTLGGQELQQQHQSSQHQSGSYRNPTSNINSVIYSSVSDLDLSPSNTTTTAPFDGNTPNQLPENKILRAESPSVIVSDKEVEGIFKDESHQPVETVLESISATRRNASTCTTSCGTITEPDLLGPCEPGSKVVLEGVVWLETPGMMVINASWRGRAYLGTLLDASKNTLGPSCPDKMISSLSMVRGRHNWGNNGVYKNPANNSSKLFNSINANVNSLSQLTGTNGGVAMTTRAAAAAAAATDRTGTDEESGSTRSSTTGRRRGTGIRNAGGTKRKRRRGSANSSAAADHDPSTPQPAAGSESDTQQHNYPGEQASEEQQPNQFICPHPGCEKRFSDMLGVRFHLDMGHTHANVEPVQQKTCITSLPTTSKKPRDREETSTSNPPRLAKAKTVRSASLTYADDDQPPPQLDRGPDDEVPVVGNDHTEPPAASPAYSDISDDGASPMPSTVINRAQLFQNGHRGNPLELFAAGLPSNATSKSPLLNNNSPVGVRTTSPGGFYMRAPADFIALGMSGAGGSSPMNGSTPSQKSPYDFPSTPYHPGPPLPSNGLPPFGLQRSVATGVIPPYQPHMSRSMGGPSTSIHLSSQRHMNITDKRFQTHLATVMAAGGLSKSLSPQQMNRQSPQSTSTPSGMPFR